MFEDKGKVMITKLKSHICFVVLLMIIACSGDNNEGKPQAGTASGNHDLASNVNSGKEDNEEKGAVDGLSTHKYEDIDSLTVSDGSEDLGSSVKTLDDLQSVQLIDVAIGTDSITLKWNDANAESYNVLWNNSGKEATTATEITFTGDVSGQNWVSIYPCIGDQCVEAKSFRGEAKK